MLTRRTFLGGTLRAAAGTAAAPVLEAFAVKGSTESATIALSRGSNVPVHVPADFIGLGYEMSSVAPLGLLSATNERYVRLVKQLGGNGVMRLGGIVADYTRYNANGTIAADPHHTVITRASLEQLAGFLKKSGWTAIWSVNFAQGTIEGAVTEAIAVQSALGSSLLAFEIGNEVENYGRGAKPFRTPFYTYQAYRAEYTAWRAAIVNAIPSARFAAPDTADNVEWVENMARDAVGDVQLLTTHYYRGDEEKGSAEQLLKPDPRLLDKLVRLRSASIQSKIPWRMCETNSFFGGGRPGVSNTFTGALWTLDFMLLLASYGCSGVNIETGVNQLGFISSYSPIQDDDNGLNSAGAPYYGMLAFAAAREGSVEAMRLDLSPEMQGITAYAFVNNGRVRSAVVIHRGKDRVNVSVGALGLRRSSTMRLAAPAADSTTGITFGGANVDATGRWAALHVEKATDGIFSLPGMSAVVLRT